MEKQWKPWLLQGVHDLPPPQHGHKSKCNQSHKQSFINTKSHRSKDTVRTVSGRRCSPHTQRSVRKGLSTSRTYCCNTVGRKHQPVRSQTRTEQARVCSTKTRVWHTVGNVFPQCQALACTGRLMIAWRSKAYTLMTHPSHCYQGVS